MNICYPGNCICDSREWEGDTDCFGNTAEDDIRINSGKSKPVYDSRGNILGYVRT